MSNCARQTAGDTEPTGGVSVVPRDTGQRQDTGLGLVDGSVVPADHPLRSADRDSGLQRLCVMMSSDGMLGVSAERVAATPFGGIAQTWLSEPLPASLG